MSCGIGSSVLPELTNWVMISHRIVRTQEAYFGSKRLTYHQLARDVYRMTLDPDGAGWGDWGAGSWLRGWWELALEAAVSPFREREL